MKITYDREVDALYIRFKEVTVTTKHLAEGIAADYDADGHLAGIEILDAMKRLGDPTVFKQIILEDVALGRTYGVYKDPSQDSGGRAWPIKSC